MGVSPSFRHAQPTRSCLAPESRHPPDISTLTQRIVSEIEAAPEPVQAEVLDFVLFVKARAGTTHIPGSSGRIQRTPGVCGGEACVGMTRIAVWMLEEARRAGVGDLDLLKDYPGLSVFDLEAAWQYVETHHEEIDEAICRNQVLSPSTFDVGRSMSDVPGFARRAARGNTADLAEILAKVPDASLAPGDERE